MSEAIHKEDLYCGYCGTQEFVELKSNIHPGDSAWSIWECFDCKAQYELNPGYGYFTTYWGNNSPHSLGSYSLATGELLDDSLLPRTPEGIVRHSDSKEKLEEYLRGTQIK